MFFMSNQRRNGNESPMSGFMGPMGMMSGMPGPMMMARMMPFVMGQALACEEPETRKQKLLEMIAGIVGQSTSDMSDEDYGKLVDELADTLRNREEVEKQSPADCCG